MTITHELSTDRPIALITGATRGIGAAIAQELSRTHTIIVGGSSDESVAAACDRLIAARQAAATGSNTDISSRDAAATVRPFVADLSDFEQMHQAVEDLHLERLDILVHSAGTMAPSSTIAETMPDEWLRVLRLNVVAVAELTRLLLPALRAAGGQVVAINSGAGYRVGADNAVYSASKFALRAFTDALREQERGTIRVTSVHPGRVDTDMQVDIQQRAGRSYRPSDHLRPQSVAAAVRMAVDASEEAMVENLEIRPVVPRSKLGK